MDAFEPDGDGQATCHEPEEQILCVKCGLCCDGTLFGAARVAEEDLIQLAKLPMHFEIAENKHQFRLPCHYLKDKCCSVYAGWRPKICSKFFCGTIVRFRNREITFDEALLIIETTLSHVVEVRNSFHIPTAECRKSLRSLFKSYTASHPQPQQAIILKYAALQHRLNRYFRNNSTSK